MRILGCALLVCAGLVQVGCGSKNKTSNPVASVRGTGPGTTTGEPTLGAKSNADKIVGVWVITKSKEAPPGAKMEYTREGKIIVTIPDKGKDQTMAGTYKVEGDKISVTFKGGGKEVTDSATILTLDETTLITRDKKGEVEEAKRK